MVERHTYTLFEKSPRYSCIKYFNKLPVPISEEEAMSRFKKKLKAYLVEKCFYKVNDFLNVDISKVNFCKIV